MATAKFQIFLARGNRGGITDQTQAASTDFPLCFATTTRHQARKHNKRDIQVPLGCFQRLRLLTFDLNMINKSPNTCEWPQV